MFDKEDLRFAMFEMIDDSIYRLKWADDQDDLALRSEYARGIILAYRYINLINKDECLALLEKMMQTFVTELHKIVDEKDGK